MRRRAASVLWSALYIVLSVQCVTAGVHAEAVCETKSNRSARSIFSRNIEGAEAPVVSIMQGETLCLEVTADGPRARLSAVERSTSALRLTLSYEKGYTTLEVTNPGPGSLWYETLRIPRGKQPLAAGETSRASFQGARPDVILYGFRLEAPPVPMRRGEGVVRRDWLESELPPRPFWLGISGILSVHHNRQRELDAEFRRNGYSELETNQPVAGFAFDFGWERWRFATDLGCWQSRNYARVSDRARYDVWQCVLAAYAGWDLAQYRGLSVFPMLGIGGGDLRLEYDPADPPLLRGALLGHEGLPEVRRNLFLAAALWGVEYRWRLSADVSLLFGMRIGYVQQHPRRTDGSLPDGTAALRRAPLTVLVLGQGAIRSPRRRRAALGRRLCASQRVLDCSRQKRSQAAECELGAHRRHEALEPLGV